MCIRDSYRIVHKNYNFVVMEFMKDGEILPTVRLPKNCYDFYEMCIRDSQYILLLSIPT